ncbi:MAG: hypothetical protein Kow002_21050 [Anaerolineales bacterium]
MAENISLLALFSDLEPAADAMDKLRDLGLAEEQMNVISGVPLNEAMLGRAETPSNVPKLALGGAIAGFLAGSYLAFGTPYAYPYPIQVGRQATIPGPPSVIVLFELTMLFMLLATFLGVFLDSYFPRYKPMEYVPEISDGKIAILFNCPEKEQGKFIKAMTTLGAEKVEVAEAKQL